MIDEMFYGMSKQQLLEVSHAEAEAATRAYRMIENRDMAMQSFARKAKVASEAYALASRIHSVRVIVVRVSAYISDCFYLELLIVSGSPLAGRGTFSGRADPDTAKALCAKLGTKKLEDAVGRFIELEILLTKEAPYHKDTLSVFDWKL